MVAEMSDYTTHRRTRAKRYGYLKPAPRERPATTSTAPAVRYGFAQERRAVHVFSFTDAVTPDWFLSIRHSTQDEDLYDGVDAWVTTSDGDIAVQIKSSALRAKQFREAHPGARIAVVVLHMSMTDRQVRDRIIQAVARLRACEEREAA